MSTSYNEAEKIYYAIFRRKIPTALATHFHALSKNIESRFSNVEVYKYSACVAKVRDLEACELAARHLKKMPILTAKFKVMLYLGETSPDNYSSFINMRDNLVAGYLQLTFALFRSVYKLIKGIIIFSVYRL